VKRLLVVPVLAMLAAGCPKQDGGGTTATPVPSPGAVEAGKGRVDPETVPSETMLKAANGWHGVYKNLLAVIHAPEDKASFSQFSEFGWKDAFPYKEYGAQPAGWWVYVAPYWFVWDTRDGQKENTGSAGALIPADGKIPPAGERNGFVDPTSLPGHIVFRAALGKTDARYSNMLAAIQDPDDVKEFSKFSEYGYQPVKNYKTYGQAPAGFWVYVEPYWIVWNLKDGRTGP
jgi:hypothetical protein